MSEELTYKQLRDLTREEKVQAGLVKLPAEFYGSVEAYLCDKHSNMEETRQVLQIHEFQNSLAIIKELVSIRQQKILFRAIRGGDHKATEDMTREEHELYDRFCAVLEDENGKLNRMLSKFSKGSGQAQKGAGEGVSQGGAAGSKLKKVRFVKDIPAYIGRNKEKVGPFKPGEEGLLPDEEAELLLKEKLAEMVESQ